MATVLDHPLIVIPGSQKAGTATLFAVLARHQRVVEPRVNESQFFALEAATIEQNWEWYRGLYRPATKDQLLLDTSTFYLWSERAPDNIRRHAPEARILIILRDPARRAFSSYLHMVKRARPLERRSFDDLLGWLEERAAGLGLREAEAALLERAVAEGSIDADYFDAGYLRRLIGAPFDAELEDPLWAYQYLARSAYRDGVERFERAFPGRLKLVFLEELASDHGRVVREVLGFLDLAVDEPLLAPTRANATAVPTSALGRWVARRRERGGAVASATGALRRLGLGRLVDAVTDAVLAPPPRMTPDQRRRAVALLRDEYDYWHRREPRLRELWPV